MIWRVILLCLLIANQALAVRLPSEHDAFTGATIAYQYDELVASVSPEWRLDKA